MPEGKQQEYWEEIFSSREWGSYPPEELVRFIARNFGSVIDRAQLNILEVGCGPGPNIWYLSREGYTIAGIDGSSTAINQAHDRLAKEGLPTERPLVDLRVGNFIELPWEDHSFDAIIDVEALYANPIDTIRKVIGEIHRTLKPGGLFFGKMFGDASTGSNTGTLMEKGTRMRPTAGPCAGNEIAHFFSKDELLNLFSEFSSVNLDHCLRTDKQGALQIFEWLVTAKK